MFTQKSQVKEDCKTNSTYVFEFPYKEIKSIINIKASCGCTSAINFPEENVIRAVVKTTSVPRHLEAVGKYVSNLNIGVIYINTKDEEVSDTLFITCTVSSMQQ